MSLSDGATAVDVLHIYSKRSCNSGGDTDTATLTITITGSNNTPPVADEWMVTGTGYLRRFKH